jgi:hypothetical protein
MRGRPKGSVNIGGGKRGRKARSESTALVFEDSNFKIEREALNWVLTDKATKRIGFYGNLHSVFSKITESKIASTTYSALPEITAAYNGLRAYKDEVMKDIDARVAKDAVVEEVA